MFWVFGHEAYGIYLPNQGFNMHPLHWKGVLTTGLPRKSQVYSLLLSFFLNSGSLDFNTSFYCFYGSPLQYSCLENPMDGRAW